MTVRLAEMWTCDACQAVEEVEVTGPTWLPPAGWSARDGGDLCMDCLTQRNRNVGGGVGG